MNKRVRHCWTESETLGFLKCYRARRIEFLTGQKKLELFDKVYQDMLKKGILNSDNKLDAHFLENRLKWLLVNYRNAVENPELAKRRSMAPYMSIMKTLFGNVGSDDEEDVVHEANKNGSEEVNKDEEDDTDEDEEESSTDSPMPMSSLTPPGSDSLKKNKCPENIKQNINEKLQDKHAQGSKKPKSSVVHQSKGNKKENLNPVENGTKPKKSSKVIPFSMGKDEFNKARREHMKESNELNRAQKVDFFKLINTALAEQWRKDSKIERKKIELMEKFLDIQEDSSSDNSQSRDNSPGRDNSSSRDNSPSPTTTTKNDQDQEICVNLLVL